MEFGNEGNEIGHFVCFQCLFTLGIFDDVLEVPWKCKSDGGIGTSDCMVFRFHDFFITSH